MFLTKIFFYTVLTLFSTISSEDENKFNVKFVENFNSKAGIYLPWVKICSNNLHQIDPSVLVRRIYKTDVNYNQCSNIKNDDQYFICRAQMSNGVKIVGSLKMETKNCSISKLNNEMYYSYYKWPGKQYNCYEVLTNPKLLHLDFIKISVNQTNLKLKELKFYVKPILTKWTGQTPIPQAAFIGTFDQAHCFYPKSCLIQKTKSNQKVNVYFGQAIIRGWKYINILVAKLGYKG